MQLQSVYVFATPLGIGVALNTARRPARYSTLPDGSMDALFLRIVQPRCPGIAQSVR